MTREQHNPSVAELLAQIKELESRVKMEDMPHRVLSTRIRAVVASLVVALGVAVVPSFAGAAPSSPVFWNLGGNGGTSPGSNYLGTSDATGLSIRTNGTQAIGIDASQNVTVNGSLNAQGGLQENGSPLSSSYAQVNGSNATGTWPIGISGTATGFTGSLSGDITGAQGATQVDKLQGKTVSASNPASGQVLTYDGSQWAPANLPAPPPPHDPPTIAAKSSQSSSWDLTMQSNPSTHISVNGSRFTPNGAVSVQYMFSTRFPVTASTTADASGRFVDYAPASDIDCGSPSGSVTVTAIDVTTGLVAVTASIPVQCSVGTRS